MYSSIFFHGSAILTYIISIHFLLWDINNIIIIIVWLVTRYFYVTHYFNIIVII